jgi:hypothetical protein
MKKFFLAFGLIIFFSFQSRADLPPAPVTGSDDCPEDSCDEASTTPLDDHVIWLIGASATIGAIALRWRIQKT